MTFLSPLFLAPVAMFLMVAAPIAVAVALQWVAGHPVRIARFLARVRIVRRLTRTAPLRVRIVVIALVVYLVSPLDLIPDFIPGLGVLDNVLILGAVSWYVRRHDPRLARAIRNLVR